MTLLGGRDGVGEREPAVNMCDGLLVSERAERGGVGKTLSERASFFEEAIGEHGGCALINALVQDGAIGGESNAENAISGERIAGLPVEEFAHGLARRE